MGRLFWKFFAFIWLAQLTAIWGVSTGIWFLRHSENLEVTGPDTTPAAAYLVQSASDNLMRNGPDGLKSYLRQGIRRQLYVVDESGQDILNRKIDRDVLDKARTTLERNPANPTVQRMTYDGHPFTLFVVETIPLIRPRNLFPVFPVLAATLASLIFAYLLARYVSRPIQHLRNAIAAASTGNLKVNLEPVLGKRKDELADLGHDFDHMANQLSALVEGQRRLLHIISHELRSPLSRLHVAVGLMRQQPENTEPSIERIERECQRMDKLIGELLTLSKLDAKVPLSLQEPVALGGLLHDIIDDARFEAEAHGKTVAFSGETEESIRGNADLLHLAFENVIRNAIRYADSSVTVFLGSSVVDGVPNIAISICDDGPGVSEAELEQIFEPFYRASNNNGSADGHGLGLAIARKTLEVHGGRIIAKNRDQKGLCIEILLPRIPHMTLVKR
jgi:two-component system OmpR family sensor kinase